MAKKILEIYNEYKIKENLQHHMLRVAAVAFIICDNFDEPLPKEDILMACLFHDMGNIIKSDLTYFPEFNEPEGVEYWQNIKDEYIDKYGKNEHHATLQIMKELDLPTNVVDVVSKVDFYLACNNLNDNNFVYNIVNYADWRVDPYGIVSYEERMEEGNRRYKNMKGYSLEGKKLQKLLACGKEIEKQIFSKCKIKPEDINDEMVKPIISSLKDFVIK